MASEKRVKREAAYKAANAARSEQRKRDAEARESLAATDAAFRACSSTRGKKHGQPAQRNVTFYQNADAGGHDRREQT